MAPNTRRVRGLGALVIARMLARPLACVTWNKRPERAVQSRHHCLGGQPRGQGHMGLRGLSLPHLRLIEKTQDRPLPDRFVICDYTRRPGKERPMFPASDRTTGTSRSR